MPCIIREWDSMETHSWGLSVNKLWQESQMKEEMVAKLKQVWLQPWDILHVPAEGMPNEHAKWWAPFFLCLVDFWKAFDGRYGWAWGHPSGLQHYSNKSVEMCMQCRSRCPEKGVGLALASLSLLPCDTALHQVSKKQHRLQQCRLTLCR